VSGASDPLSAARIDAAQLLVRTPADALASYFALEHDARRTKLFVSGNGSGRTTAFVAVCQTGIDLFRPLAVMRADDDDALRALMRTVLQPGRHYLLSAPPSLQPVVADACHLHGESVNAVYALSPEHFRPVPNVLVRTSRTPDKLPRAAILARDGSNAAEAGASWISSRYAEIYVQVAEPVRRRGLGKSVVGAVCSEVLSQGRTPLYVTATDNVASRKLAERLGFVDSGAFELTGAIELRA